MFSCSCALRQEAARAQWFTAQTFALTFDIWRDRAGVLLAARTQAPKPAPERVVAAIISVTHWSDLSAAIHWQRVIEAIVGTAPTRHRWLRSPCHSKAWSHPGAQHIGEPDVPKSSAFCAAGYLSRSTAVSIPSSPTEDHRNLREHLHAVEAAAEHGSDHLRLRDNHVHHGGL